jgi:hypothetical protein
VVIIHGMGEQRPLETLNEFIAAALKAAADGKPAFYSRPDLVTDSYEARRYLAPAAMGNDGVEDHAQTEFYEYHWAHLMVGNKLTDLWPTFRRLLLQGPSRVPSGLIGLWVLVWLLIVGAVLFFWLGPGSHFDLATVTLSGLISGIIGGGVVAVLLTFLVADVIPGWLTSSFVDVVRYLDTSPRSYAVRHQIRKGIVDLLAGLHDAHRYQSTVVVAHSLGSYIAYDAISFLWGQMSGEHRGPPRIPVKGGQQPDGLRQLEEVASALLAGQADADAYQAAQRSLWRVCARMAARGRARDELLRRHGSKHGTTHGHLLAFGDRSDVESAWKGRCGLDDRGARAVAPPHRAAGARRDLDLGCPPTIWTRSASQSSARGKRFTGSNGRIRLRSRHSDWRSCRRSRHCSSSAGSRTCRHDNKADYHGGSQPTTHPMHSHPPAMRRYLGDHVIIVSAPKLVHAALAMKTLSRDSTEG